MTAPIDPTPPPPPVGPPGVSAAPSSGRMSPPALIAIVVGGVLLLGGLVFAIGWAANGGAKEVPLAEQQVVEETAEVLTPIPDAPAPMVEPIPDEPTLEPIPDEPIVEVIPEEPVLEVPNDQTGEQTTSESTTTESMFPIGSGISAVVPEGWAAEALDEATVAMGTDDGGAVLAIYTAPAGTTGAELISFYQQETLSQQMTDLDVTQPEPLALDVASITSAATALYSGTYVSQQGSFPLEGMVWAFIRADGTALVIDGYWAPGVDILTPLTDITVSALTTM